MNEVYVIHYNEIALKGRNRPLFLQALQNNICNQARIKDVKIFPGRLIAFSNNESIKNKLKKVFGISSVSKAIFVKANYKEIEKAIEAVTENTEFTSFAIQSTRGDKRFMMTSQELNIKLGSFVNEKFGKKVDLTNPNITFYVEVFEKGALVYNEKIQGAGGLPIGTQGKAIALLSGGIDSPVATLRIMQRGVEVVGVHFHSYPFTTRASIDKVKQLASIVSEYGSLNKVYYIPIADAQKEIVKNCDGRYRVLLYRRLMLKIAQEVANKEKAKALVTGESLGQVASQTMDNLVVTDASVSLPVLRPLIGYDKHEIISEAEKMGTFKISIEPHDDCCTLFMPKNVATHARIEDVEKEESKLDMKLLIENAISKAEEN